jgi:hypothetical protein
MLSHLLYAFETRRVGPRRDRDSFATDRVRLTIPASSIKIKQPIAINDLR